MERRRDRQADRQTVREMNKLTNKQIIGWLSDILCEATFTQTTFAQSGPERERERKMALLATYPDLT